MAPPQLHMSLEELSRAGFPFIITKGVPIIHGEVVMGTQAWGIPRAAATSGLEGVVHNPKGIMFKRGMWS